MNNTRDEVILVDGALRGASLSFCAFSAWSLLDDVRIEQGLVCLAVASSLIALSWIIPRVYSDMDLGQ